MIFQVCPTCSKRVGRNTQALGCDAYGGWYHRRCVHISKGDCKTLGRLQQMWFCRSCLIRIKTTLRICTQTPIDHQLPLLWAVLILIQSPLVSHVTSQTPVGPLAGLPMVQAAKQNTQTSLNHIEQMIMSLCHEMEEKSAKAIRNSAAWTLPG